MRCILLVKKKIIPNPYQPRREFDQDRLSELSASIRQYGVLQPLVVSRQETMLEDGGIKVEYDKVDDYYGFEIDGNRLFLLEDMTVTHNTAFVLSMARNIAIDFGHPVAIFSLESLSSSFWLFSLRRASCACW